MKSKRLTILCVAVVALAGSPRVWHETGKLIAIVQHKAQVKFWSMILQPGDRESSNVEVAANYDRSDARSGEVAANCPLEQGTRQGNQAMTGRRDSTRSEPKAKAAQKTVSARAFIGPLIAKALRTRKNEDSESLRHSRSMIESGESLIDERRLAMALDAAPPLPPPSWSDGNTFRFALTPAASPVATVLVEKETMLRLKTIKKALEDNKLVRPKGRSRNRSSDFGVRI